MAVNKKINNLSISTSAKEPSRPKITSDIIATYLELMGGQATLVKPDGSQYNPDRKGRVMIGDRMTTAEKFGQAGDVGLNNEFTKLPEVHARFDDRMTALQVQKEIATGKLTTQKFFEVPSKEIANQAADEIRRSPDIKLGRGEIIDVRPSGKGYEVVAVKQYQPIPSRGNTLARTYNLNNDPAGTFVGFNKPEEAYSAPKSLKELQAEIRSQQKQLSSAYKELNASPDMTKTEYLRAIKPMQNELAADENLRTKAKLVLDDIRSRIPEPIDTPDSSRSQLTDYVKQQAIASPTMGEKALQQIQETAIAPDAQTRINNIARDTGGYPNAVGEPFNPPRTNVKPIDISQPRFAAEMGVAINPTGISDRGYYNKVAAAYADDNFGLGDRLKPFPDFYDLKRRSVAEGVRDEAFQNYIKGKANAPLIEAGIMKAPELPMTARLGQEYISPKTGNVGTVESVGKKGVKLNVDGQVVPVEYRTLEKLKYTGNKGYGISANTAMDLPAKLAKGFAMREGSRLLARQFGANEEQQNAIVDTVTVANIAGSLYQNVARQSGIYKAANPTVMQRQADRLKAKGIDAKLEFIDPSQGWFDEFKKAMLDPDTASTREFNSAIFADDPIRRRLIDSANRLGIQTRTALDSDGLYELLPANFFGGKLAKDVQAGQVYGFATTDSSGKSSIFSRRDLGSHYTNLVISHELGHIEAGHFGERAHIPEPVHEFEADAISYGVYKKLGLANNPLIKEQFLSSIFRHLDMPEYRSFASHLDQVDFDALQAAVDRIIPQTTRSQVLVGGAPLAKSIDDRYVAEGFTAFQQQSLSNKQGFEYGQKFISPKSGESASLVTADMKGGAVLETLKGDRIELTSDQYKKLNVKSPATLTDLKRGDGLIVDSKASQFNGQRYTVMSSDTDKVQLRGESGDIRSVPKDKIAGNFRANTLGFSTPAMLATMFGATAGTVLGYNFGRKLAKDTGLNEDQQNLAGFTGGALGGVTGGSLSLAPFAISGDAPKTTFKMPTAKELAINLLLGGNAVSQSRYGKNFDEIGSINPEKVGGARNTANKKIADVSISTSIKEPSRPKITSDIIATYLDLMGGQATLVKPDGSQYNPDRKGRVMIGDRMTTAEKFGQAGDVGLNNEFTKLPEVHARFDDRMTALQVQKEIATGKLTTQKFFEVPSKEIANQAADEIRRSPDIKLGRGEIIDVRQSGKGYEVVAVKQYQPIPSRGNTLARTYNLNNDPAGTFVGFNKPEEAYSAPKSLKELQAEIGSQQKRLSSAYKELNVSPDMTRIEYLRAIKPMQNELAADENLRTKAKLVLDDIRARTPETAAIPESPRSPLSDYIKQQIITPPTMGEKALQQIQETAIAPDAQTRINNTARDTGGYPNAVGESFVTNENVAQKRVEVAAERARFGRVKQPFSSQRLAEVDRYGIGAPLDDQAAYDLAKNNFETIKRSALEYPDAFKGVDQSAKYPSFSNLKKQALSEGIMLADSGTKAFEAYAIAKASELTGTLKVPESGLPVTARLGQEYISPKTGNVGTVESVGKKGVKLNVDGQVVPVEYKTLERLKYTGNKDYGFMAPAALRPALGGFAVGTLGAIAFKQIAKAAGLNEDQQNIAASVGGVAGSLTGGSLSLFKPTTELKLPTPQQFARNVVGLPAVNDSGMFLSAEGRNKMRLNQLNQYDVKPVLSEIAVLGTDLLTPHPYGIATVPAMRTATESWKNNYDTITERGLSAVKTTAAGATSAIKDFTYQTLTQLGRSAGLPFPMTEQAVGQVLDAIPNSQQIMSMGDRAKARLSRRYSGESGMVMMGDRSQVLTDLQRKAIEFSQKYDSGAIAKETYSNKRAPIQKLTLDQSSANMGMSPQEFAKFQEEAYKSFPVKTESPKGSGKLPKYVEPSRFATDPKTGDRFDMQSFREANTEWRRSTDEASKPLRVAYDDALKSGDRETQKAVIEAMDELKSNLPPAPVKADYLAPLDKPVKISDRKVFNMGAMSESAMDARRAVRVQGEAPMTGYQRKFGLLDEAAGEIVKPKSGFQKLVDNVTDSLFQPKKSSGGFGKSTPKASNFIAESAVEIAAKSSGATTAQVKAQIASQRSVGKVPDLNVATEAMATQKQSKQLAVRSLPVQSRELAVRSLTELKPQSKELSTKVLSRQQPDGMIATPSQSMINAGMKSQRVKLGDRIGASGLGILMDTSQAANVLNESASRGENTQTALTRAGLSVTAGYTTTGLASFIPNPYLRTAAQLVGGIGAVIGADKALDQVVGRNEAKEQKFAKDLSKLDLQTTDEKQQWKPFANDSNIAAAYGNSLAAQFQSNLDYRPAARSLANLTNKDAIDNARYASERDTSIKTGMDAKSNKSIAFEDRGNGVTVGYNRDRGYTSTESRVLALQNLANESGYSVDRTGKFNSKTLDALEGLGYSQNQITEYIQGRTQNIGKPRQSGNAGLVVKQVLANRSGEKVTSQQLSQALSAQRKAEGLKFGEKLSDAAVAGAFNSLAGKSLNELRRSPIVGGNKTQSLLKMGAGFR